MTWDTGVQSQLESYQKTQKMVLDTPLLNTHQYKVRIKSSGAIQIKEQCPLLHLGVVATEKGAFRSPSTPVNNFTIYIYIIRSPMGVEHSGEGIVGRP